MFLTTTLTHFLKDIKKYVEKYHFNEGALVKLELDFETSEQLMLSIVDQAEGKQHPKYWQWVLDANDNFADTEQMKTEITDHILLEQSLLNEGEDKHE